MILLVSLLCLDVVSRTARVSPENPTVSAAIGQIVPQSDKTKCISVKRKGNTTFAEAEEGSRDFSAMAAGWTFATTIKDAAAEEFWAVLEKTELTPHINAFTLTGSGTKFRVLYRLDWADTDAPMLYLGLTADGQIWIFRELVLPQFVPACRVQLAGGSDGFRAMTLGRTLWTVVLLKLLIMFGILKLFFFPDTLGGFENERQKGDYVIERMLDSKP